MMKHPTWKWIAPDNGQEINRPEPQDDVAAAQVPPIDPYIDPRHNQPYEIQGPVVQKVDKLSSG